MFDKKSIVFALTCFLFSGLAAQNISGEKITIGRESITIINFPDKVLNINFSDDAAYDFYTPKRREEKSISLQFNKEKESGPSTNLLVNEGGRSHMFRLIYDSTYNINDDSRPPLWYDHSDLKELKAFVQKLKEDASKPQDEASLAKEKKEKEERDRKEAEQRRSEALAAQKQQEEAAAEKEKELEKQRKAEAQEQKEQAAELAKAKKEAEDKEKQAKIAADKEEQARKLADEKARKDAEALAKTQAEEDKRLADLKAKQEAEARVKEQALKEAQAKKDEDALAKAQADKERKDREAAEALAKAEKEAEDRKKLEEEKVAKQKAAEEEKRKLAEEEAAKKEAERIAAQERLAKLQEERELTEENKRYSEVGLWQRYGSKGIDLYNFPRNHVPTVISDFYIARDTVRNFRISDSILKADIPDKLNITAEAPVNKGVNITLENMVFKDIQTFYKIKVENTTDEDFLLGRTYIYWYDANNKAKQIIKSTYITYISFFPIVRPKSTRYIVFSTRSPNMLDDESMVLFVDERRKDKGSASIVISGATYNKELAKVQAAANKNKKGIIEEEEETEVVPQPQEKKSKKKKKK